MKDCYYNRQEKQIVNARVGIGFAVSIDQCKHAQTGAAAGADSSPAIGKAAGSWPSQSLHFRRGIRFVQSTMAPVLSGQTLQLLQDLVPTVALHDE
jgi:hypothetical protein